MLICYLKMLSLKFLPPAIRRMTEGYIFSLSTFRGGGGPRSQIFQRGDPRSQIFGGGGSQVSDFLGGGGGGSQVSVKGKIFDTRFDLIHVQTGKIFFCQGTPPPPPGIARNCYGYTQEDFLVALYF